MLRCVAEATVAEDVVVPAQHGPESAAPMDLSHRTCPAGETVVDFGGELDIVSAEVAVSYVRDVIDRHHGPVTVNLTALAFCDAKGLAALVRMARYAEQKGRPFRLEEGRDKERVPFQFHGPNLSPRIVGGCVEVSATADTASVLHKADQDLLYLLRDSKDPKGPKLAFTTREWDAFIAGVKDGEFDPA